VNAAERSRVSFLTLPRKGHPGLGESDPVDLTADIQRQEMGGKGQAKSHFLFVVSRRLWPYLLTFSLPLALPIPALSLPPLPLRIAVSSTPRCCFSSLCPSVPPIYPCPLTSLLLSPSAHLTASNLSLCLLPLASAPVSFHL